MSGTKTIKVTDLPISYVEALDKRAKEISDKTGIKVSRNKLIKQIIEYELEHKHYEKAEEKFQDALTDNRLVISHLVDSINRHTHSSEALIAILTSH